MIGRYLVDHPDRTAFDLAKMPYTEFRNHLLADGGHAG